MFATLPALAATLGGTSLLFLSWRRSGDGLPALRWAGWLLLTLATALWVAGHGAEAGVLLGLFVPPLAAWALVSWDSAGDSRPERRARRERSAAAENDNDRAAAPSNWLRHAGLFLLTVPLAGISATLFSLLLTAWLPWSQVNQLALATFLMPVLWGAAAFWGCADPQPRRPALALLAIGLASGLLLSLSA